MVTANSSAYFSASPDAFVCPKCDSILVDYDEGAIIYNGSDLSKAYYSCECLDCKNKFNVLLKDTM